jgi:FkbM family methyltransferase
MLTAWLAQKIGRARDAVTLTLRHTRDVRSAAALLSCYAAIFRDPNDTTPVFFDLAFDGRRYRVHMRKSDIFTLAEIFRERQYALVSAVPDAPLVIDGGANIGLSVIWFLARHPGATVHCFEPEPGNLRLLRANVGDRTDVVVNAQALGQGSGRVALHVSESGAMHSVVDRDAGAQAVDVDVVDLASYLQHQRLATVDVLKLDIEGSEMDALEGLGDRIHDVAIIVGEFHERLVDEDRFYGYLQQRGFVRIRRQPSGEAGVHIFEVARRTAGSPKA